MSEAKAADVRFYVDADLLGLAQVLASLRPDVTYPGDPGATVRGRVRPPCPLTTPDLTDDVWIPEVARRGWLAITRDRNIQDRRSYLNLIRDFGGRLVTLSSADARDKWTQLEVVMTQWRRIEALLEEPGPFVYTVTRVGGLTRVPGV